MLGVGQDRVDVGLHDGKQLVNLWKVRNKQENCISESVTSEKNDQYDTAPAYQLVQHVGAFDKGEGQNLVSKVTQLVCPCPQIGLNTNP